MDPLALCVVGAVVIVGGVVVGLGVGCYYAGKGAWWLGKKGVEAASDANEARKTRSFNESLKERSERRKIKGKSLEATPVIPEQFMNMSADETAQNCGVFTLRFGSCKDLKNLDAIGKSDPYAKIYFTDCKGTKLHYFKTYTIDEELSPVWDLDDITIHFFPGMELLIKVYDEDPGRDELEGIIRVPLSELMSSTQSGAELKTVTYDLQADKNNARGNSVSQLINPKGITKANVRGSTTFQFAYITDEMLKAKGLDKL
jgi:hypothetical protein